MPVRRVHFTPGVTFTILIESDTNMGALKLVENYPNRAIQLGTIRDIYDMDAQIDENEHPTETVADMDVDLMGIGIHEDSLPSYQTLRAELSKQAFGLLYNAAQEFHEETDFDEDRYKKSDWYTDLKEGERLAELIEERLGDLIEQVDEDFSFPGDDGEDEGGLSRVYSWLKGVENSAAQ